MRVLVDSYNECFQNDSGGVRIKIEYFCKYLSRKEDVKLYDKWNDKIVDYDLLHIFKPGIQHYSLVKLAKNYQKPVIVSAVAPSESNQKIRQRKIIEKLFPVKTAYSFTREIYELSDAIIAETIYEKNFICSMYCIEQEKVFVIPNGISFNKSVDLDLFAKTTGIEGDFLLQVGRFDSNKNQLNTIKALEGTNIKLVLIGGADKDDLEYYNACKKYASDNVHFLGWIDHEDPLLLSAYYSCHSFILPSYKEILGNALLEAAYCGANIVATNVLPLDSWGIKGLCYIVNPGDIEDIKTKIISAMTAEKSNELKKIVDKKFNWNNVIDEHMEIYKRVLDDNK